MESAKLKEESEILPGNNDLWLREWSESKDVKVEMKVEIDMHFDSEAYGQKKAVERNESVQKDTGEKTKAEKPHSNEKLRWKQEKRCILDMLIEKLCREVPVSDRLSNLCKFKCPECDKHFKGWQILNIHLVKSHHIKTISVHDVEKVISKVVYHICKVCSAKILCDNTFMRRHLRVHKMSLSHYFDQFGRDIKTYLPEVSYSDNLVGSFCLYVCHVCGSEFSFKTSLQEHQRASSHESSSRPEYEMKKIVYHKCKLCSKSICCDIRVLTSHFKTHGISLKEYCIKTGCTIIHQRQMEYYKVLKSFQLSKAVHDSCVFVCKPCNNRHFYSYQAFQQHHKTHSKTIEPISACIVKGFSYRCDMCGQLMLCDKFLIRSHMRKHKLKTKHKQETIFKRFLPNYLAFCKNFKKSLPVSTTVHRRVIIPLDNVSLKNTSDVFGNMCIFKCSFCALESLHSWKELEKHCQTFHNKKAGLAYDKSMVQTARYHLCLLCPRAVLNDRQFLTRHLHRSHKMKLSNYESIFLKNGGKTLPTLRDWARKGCNMAT